MYVLARCSLGVYFAMYSGTMDAIVYDTVLEETGGSDGFERRSAGCGSSRASRWWRARWPAA